ncbi:TIGR04438 family Trp-rich protein [Roseateles sp. BYS180W]|uniref:TIGR04438 family Trp-rich protein n=1 Tax=Roseateles rivi TaxID=3299028 RepID=A0ABW7FUT9_9BURK
MGFLLLGVLLLTMKWAQWGPVAQWSWLWVLSPFLLAVLWWKWADAYGYTQRKAMQRDDARREARRIKAVQLLKQSARRRR